MSKKLKPRLQGIFPLMMENKRNRKMTEDLQHAEIKSV